MPTSVFDPTAPLIRGINLIEASAGTGKTYQISNLVLRLVADEAVAIDQVMVVTFTKAATAELRERIRSRLEQARDLLAEPDGETDDPVLQALLGEDEADRARRLARIDDACEDFDTASISTIHGFCETVLQEHAFEANSDPTAQLIQSTGALVMEIVDDYLSQRRYAATPLELAFLGRGGRAKIQPSRLVQIAKAVGSNDEPVRCAGQPADSLAQNLVAAAQWWRGPGQTAFIEAVDRAAQHDQFSKPGTWKQTKKGATPKKLQERMATLDAWAEQVTEINSDHVYRLQSVKLLIDFEKSWAGGEAHRDLGLPEWEIIRSAAEEAAEYETSRFVQFVRQEFRSRLRRRNERTFDDLLEKVALAIERAPAGDLAAALRRRHAAVLIDEFQDTDSRQWTIFNRIFGDARDGEGRASHWLYLIGDPKQAIYSFRGADVHVYLAAREVAAAGDNERTLGDNYRSDGRLIHAFNTLFRDHEGVFAQPGALHYLPVGFTHEWSERFSGHQQDPALTLRLVDNRVDPGGQPTAIAHKKVGERLTAMVVADDIRRQLEATPLLTVEGHAIEPGDFAILVRTNRQAEVVADQLRAAGIPCVRAANGNVYQSDEASHLQDFLAAVDRPRDPALARRLARTPLGGWTGPALAEAFEGRGHEVEWSGWLDQIDGWSQELCSGGLARALSSILRTPSFIEHISRFDDVERRLTNYRHLTELLHATETEQRLGPAELLRWLRDRANEEDDAHDGAELRLESDEDAVQIVTIHGSKGLQYRFVYVPYLWCASSEPKDVLTYPTREGRVFDVRPRWDTSAKEVAGLERRREDLRLLYVALTRARHTVTAYWTAQFNKSAGGKGLLDASLTEVLFGGNDAGLDRRAFAKQQVEEALADDAGPLNALQDALDTLVEASRAPEHDDLPTIGYTVAMPPARQRWRSAVESGGLAGGRSFPPRGLEQYWRRFSYSSLTHQLHGAAERPEDVALEALAEIVRDGRDFDDGEGRTGPPGPPSSTAPTDEQTGETQEVPLAAFPGGPEPGSFVHKVLEEVDFATLKERDGQQRDLGDLLRGVGPRYGVTRGDQLTLLEAALPGILAQPLGAAAGDIALQDLSTSDRLDELEFDLALRGGDRHVPQRDQPVWWSAWRDLLCSARPAGSDVPPAYLKEIADEHFRLPPMAGFLTGSIDLVYRVAGDGGGRWFVCDYKTNKLRNQHPDERGRRPVTAAHYALPWLQYEMARHHYFLQYHLYTLVLHRYLQQRLPGYDYDRNMGGAVYLFVRGMSGVAAPGHGVFFDRPPREVIEGMDALFSAQPMPRPARGSS